MVDFIIENWAELLIGLAAFAKIIVNLTPTKATGIKKAVDAVAKATNTDCGCGKRRDTLNRIFPYDRD